MSENRFSRRAFLGVTLTAVVIAEVAGLRGRVAPATAAPSAPPAVAARPHRTLLGVL